jgi:peptide/nickel transport system ATP-binding protein
VSAEVPSASVDRSAGAPVVPGAPLLSIRDLVIEIRGRRLVDVAELSVARGQIVGLVGESGAGKSLLLSSILGLLPADATIRGSIAFDGLELRGAPDRLLRSVRGRRIAVVLQAARAALTPTLQAGTWIERALVLHRIPTAERRSRIAHALEAVRLDPALLERYPHQLSGGEAQRVAIALAVALRAELILADEATSALDVTVQAEVAELFRELRVTEGASFLIVSHDLALMAGLADRIDIIADGSIVERGGAEVLTNPQHRVTREMVAANPRLGQAHEAVP